MSPSWKSLARAAGALACGRPVRSAGVSSAVVALVLGSVTAGSAPAVAAPDHELPFACGQSWVGSTRATHRPGPLAVDFNRTNDLGALVLSSAPGRVLKVGDAGDRGYGKWIQVDHGDGYTTVYAHLLEQWVVVGQYVDQGSVLGRVGATGAVSGAHLHYEQRLGSPLVRPYFHQLRFVFARATSSLNCGDLPLAGDWDGDGAAEVAVFRREASARFELRAPNGTVTTIPLGASTDQPLVGDWDGDGHVEVGVHRQLIRAFYLRKRDGTVLRVRGWTASDVAVTGDWNGDDITDLGVWRPATARFRLRRAGTTDRVVRVGTPASQPVTGDWDGDGSTDVGVFDAASATFTLVALAKDGTTTTSTVVLGTKNDLPVAGDWNADGRTDVGVWSPATATYVLRTLTPSTTEVQPRLRNVTFGRPRL